jgi:hypothetical protein
MEESEPDRNSEIEEEVEVGEQTRGCSSAVFMFSMPGTGAK